jgi:hypothetical protein
MLKLFVDWKRTYKETVGTRVRAIVGCNSCGKTLWTLNCVLATIHRMFRNSIVKIIIGHCDKWKKRTLIHNYSAVLLLVLSLSVRLITFIMIYELYLCLTRPSGSWATIWIHGFSMTTSVFSSKQWTFNKGLYFVTTEKLLGSAAFW